MIIWKRKIKNLYDANTDYYSIQEGTQHSTPKIDNFDTLQEAASLI